MTEQDFIAPPELARILDLNLKTVRKRVAHGHIPQPFRITQRCVFWIRQDLIDAGILPREEVRS